MAYQLQTSSFSFVQFDESDFINDCDFGSQNICLPVLDEDDVWFQFFLTADTEEEIDAICSATGEPVRVGIVTNCADAFLLQFPEQPMRYRIGATKVLYVWQNGLPGFEDVIAAGMCFHIKISIFRLSAQTWCSNCFQRITSACHTSVIEYTNNENFAGFNYCAGDDSSSSDSDTGCDPIILQFTNQSTMSIPWTAFLRSKFGDAPNIQAWIYDDNNELVKAGIRIAMDAYPPNTIMLDFGGNGSGIVKIM